MKKHLPIIFILVCAAMFIIGVVQLFKLRFETGDVYPPYSSLRADPLGTMVLYESLEELSGLALRRDHNAAGKLPDGKDTTYLYVAALNIEWESRSEKDWKEVDAFLINGGRLAITLYPEMGWNPWVAPAVTMPGPTTATNTAAGTNTLGMTTNLVVRKKIDLRKKMRQQGANEDEIDLAEHWGVNLEHQELTKDDDNIYQPARVVNKSGLALPASLDWHSATVFSTNLDKAWKTIYARGKQSVVIERKFGAGSVVISTDSYFLSNEAMRQDRHPDLLAWMVGPNRRVVFDEAHLGIVEEGGVAVLIQKYRLHGLALAFLVLAGLFIWKNSVSLVPPDAAEKLATHVAGKDTAAGFVNLLRHNIPASDVLNVCFAEWTKSLLMGKHYTIAGVDQAQAEVEAENARPLRSRDPVGTYKRICDALTRRSPSRIGNLPTEQLQPTRNSELETGTKK